MGMPACFVTEQVPHLTQLARQMCIRSTGEAALVAAIESDAVAAKAAMGACAARRRTLCKGAESCDLRGAKQ